MGSQITELPPIEDYEKAFSDNSESVDLPPIEDYEKAFSDTSAAPAPKEETILSGSLSGSTPIPAEPKPDPMADTSAGDYAQSLSNSLGQPTSMADTAMEAYADVSTPMASEYQRRLAQKSIRDGAVPDFIKNYDPEKPDAGSAAGSKFGNLEGLKKSIAGGIDNFSQPLEFDQYGNPIPQKSVDAEVLPKGDALEKKIAEASTGNIFEESQKAGERMDIASKSVRSQESALATLTTDERDIWKQESKDSAHKALMEMYRDPKSKKEADIEQEMAKFKSTDPEWKTLEAKRKELQNDRSPGFITTLASQAWGDMLKQAAGVWSVLPGTMGKGEEGFYDDLMNMATRSDFYASLNESTVSDIARGLGDFAAIGLNPTGKTQWINKALSASTVLRAGAQAYADGLQNTGDKMEAAKGAGQSALDMALFIGGGKLLGKLQAGWIAKDASPLARGIGVFATHGPNNMIISAGLRGMRGEDMTPTVRGTTLDLAFGLHSGAADYAQSAELKKMKQQVKDTREAMFPDGLTTVDVNGATVHMATYSDIVKEGKRRFDELNQKDTLTSAEEAEKKRLAFIASDQFEKKHIEDVAHAAGIIPVEEVTTEKFSSDLEKQRALLRDKVLGPVVTNEKGEMARDKSKADATTRERQAYELLNDPSKTLAEKAASFNLKLSDHDYTAKPEPTSQAGMPQEPINVEFEPEGSGKYSSWSKVNLTPIDGTNKPATDATDATATPAPVTPAAPAAPAEPSSVGQPVPATAQPYSKEALQKTLNLTPEEAEATHIVVQAMGLDESRLSFDSTRSGATVYNQSADGKVNAEVEFMGDGTAIISGFKSANASSGVHEISHVARRQLFDRNIPAENRQGITDADVTTAEKWAGVKDGVWDRAADEKFARGFEKYLASGEAPSPQLASVFEKFKNWLLKIYKGISGSEIDIEISPEMKKVFDRLLTRSERLKGKGLKEAALDKLDISEHQKAIEAAMKPEHLAIHKSAKEKSDRGEPLTETEQLFRDSVDQQLADEGDVLRQESPLTPAERRAKQERDFKEKHPDSDSMISSEGRVYSPEVRAMIARQRAGLPIDRDALDAAVNKNIPWEKRVPLPTPENLPSKEKIENALGLKAFVNGKSRVGTLDEIRPGASITIRQDVPSMTRKGVGVVVVQSPEGIHYDSMVSFDNPEMVPPERAQRVSQEIGTGSKKQPLISIKAKLSADQSVPADINEWTQTGFNPDRHSYYYDRDSGQPVIGGKKGIQIGNTVFVKEPIFGDKADMLYQESHESGLDREIVRGLKEHVARAQSEKKNTNSAKAEWVNKELAKKKGIPDVQFLAYKDKLQEAYRMEHQKQAAEGKKPLYERTYGGEETPIASAIAGSGRILDPEQYRKQHPGDEKGYNEQYGGMPSDLTAAEKRVLFSKGESAKTPDVIVSGLSDENVGGIKQGDASHNLWEAIDKERQAHKRLSGDMGAQERDANIRDDFQRNFVRGNGDQDIPGLTPARMTDAMIGAKIVVGGEPMEVAADPDGGFILKSGENFDGQGKFGSQHVEEGEYVYVDKVLSTPDEAGEGDGKSISSTDAAVLETLKSIGAPEVEKGAKVSDEQVWNKAQEELAANPNAADELVREINDGGSRVISAREQALLLYKHVQLDIEAEALNTEWLDAMDSVKEGTTLTAAVRQRNEKLSAKRNELQQRLLEFAKANTAVGSEVGRALRFRRVMAERSFSSSSVQAQMMENLGRPLTQDEIKDAIRITGQLERLDEQVKQHRGQIVERLVDAGAKDVFDMMRSEMKLGGSLGSLFKSGNKKALSGLFSAMRSVAQETFSGFRASRKNRFTSIDSLADSISQELKPASKLQQAETALQRLTRLEAIDAADAIDSGASKEIWKQAMIKSHPAVYDNFTPEEANKRLDQAWEDAPAVAAEEIAKRAKAKYTKNKKVSDAEIENGKKQIEKALVRKSKTAKQLAEEAPDKREAVLAGVEAAKEEGGNLGDLKKAVRQIAETFIEEGERDYDTLIRRTTQEIQKYFPEAVDHDIKRLFSNYGEYKAATTDEIKVTKAHMRQQALVESQLYDILQKGRLPSRTGKARVLSPDVVRQAVIRRREEMRRLNLTADDPERQMKDSLDVRKTYYRNRLLDLAQEIATKQKIIEQKTPARSDKELEQLKSDYAQLKSERDLIFKEGLTDEQRLARAMRVAEREWLNSRQKLSDARQQIFPPKQEKAPLPYDENLEKLKAETEAYRDEYRALRDLDPTIRREKALKSNMSMIERLQKTIADYRTGTEPPKAEKEKLTDPELKQQREQIQRLRDQLEDLKAPMRELERAKQVQDDIDALTDKIDTGNISMKKRPSRRESAEIEELKRQRTVLQNELNQMRREKKGKSEAEYIKSLDNRIAEVLRKLADNDILKKTKTKFDSEEVKQREEILKELNKELQTLRDGPRASLEELALKRRKAQLSRNLAELERRIAEGDIEPKPRKEPTPLDKDGEEMQKKIEVLRHEIVVMLEKKRIEGLSWMGRSAEKFIAYARWAKITGVMVLGKLTGAATARLVLMNPAEILAGKILEASPFIGAGMQRLQMLTNRGRDVMSMTEYLRNFKKLWATTKAEAGNVLRTGKTSMEMAHGKRIYPPLLPKWMEYVAALHPLLKLPVFMNEFNRSFDSRLKDARLRGEDITNENVLDRIKNEATADGIRAKFQSDNFLTKRFSMMTARRKVPQNPTAHDLGEVAVTRLMNFLFPIISVPTNFALEAATWTPLGLASGGGRMVAKPIAESMKALFTKGGDVKQAWKDGWNRVWSEMTPENADSIHRHLVRGSIGTALMMIGMLAKDHIGGFWNRKKKKDDEVPYGDIEVFGIHFGHTFLHWPMVQALNLGASIAHMYEDNNDDNRAKAATAATFSALARMAFENPYSQGAERILMMRDKPEGVIGDVLFRGNVPMFIREIAKATSYMRDEPVNKKMDSIGAYFLDPIPWLRDQLDESGTKEKKAKSSKNPFR